MVHVVLLAVSMAAAACEAPRQRPPGAMPPDSVLRATLGLDSLADVYRVVLSGEGASERVTPSETGIVLPAYVEFFTADGRVHTVAFERDSLSAAQIAYLDGAGQLSSPPLVERGSRFVVHFENAPPGRYPFVSRAHGGEARGVILARSPG